MVERLRLPYHYQRTFDKPDSANVTRNWFEIEDVINGLSLDSAGGFDAIVDNSLAASQPTNRLFRGVGEALEYLAGTAGLTHRAFVLIRDGQAAQATYTETGAITPIPANIFLIASDPYWPAAGTAGPVWDMAGQSIDSANWFIQGIHLESSVNTGKSSFFGTGAVTMVNCQIDSPVGITGKSTLGTNTTLVRCRMVNGWCAFTRAYDCDLRIFSTGTYDPSEGAAEFTLVDCLLDVNTNGGAAVTWSLNSTKVDIRYRQGSNAGTIVPTFQLNNANGDFYIECLGRGAEPTITSPAVGSAELRGYFSDITLGAPGVAHSRHYVQTRSLSLDVTGPALLDAAITSPTSTTPVKLRGKEISGHLSGDTISSSGTWLQFIAASQNNIDVSSDGSGASGTSKSFNLDATSNKNILDFAGDTTFPVAGTNAGAGNLLRVT